MQKRSNKFWINQNWWEQELTFTRNPDSHTEGWGWLQLRQRSRFINFMGSFDELLYRDSHKVLWMLMASMHTFCFWTLVCLKKSPGSPDIISAVWGKPLFQTKPIQIIYIHSIQHLMNNIHVWDPLNYIYKPYIHKLPVNPWNPPFHAEIPSFLSCLCISRACGLRCCEWPENSAGTLFMVRVAWAKSFHLWPSKSSSGANDD